MVSLSASRFTAVPPVVFSSKQRQIRGLNPIALRLAVLALSLVNGITRAAARTGGSNPALTTSWEFLNPLFRHASVGYDVSTKAWTVPPTLNWVPTLGLSPLDQGSCNECWFLGPQSALTAILTSLQSTPYSSQASALQDYLPTTFSSIGGENNCTGGWPCAPLDNWSGYSRSNISSFAKIWYEQTHGQFDWWGLLLAVQAQPVVITMSSAVDSFYEYKSGIYSDPDCASGIVDRSMVVVGYNLTSQPPYWIMQSTLGTQFGMHGLMNVQMTGGFGICNMHSVAPIYPVTRVTGNPCIPVNLCGSGTCTVNSTSPPTYSCTCPQGFVSVKDRSGNPTCALIDVCSTFSFNPCFVGDCINDQQGHYTCSCPRGFVNGTRPDGTPVCVRNSTAFALRCSLYYSWSEGDTCRSVALRFFTSRSRLLLLNPWMRCHRDEARPDVGKQVCVRRGISPDSHPCSRYYTPSSNDSCTGIRRQFFLSARRFFALNPGLICSNLFPRLNVTGGGAFSPFGSQVCVGSKSSKNESASSGIRRELYSARKCQHGHRVVAGDFCSYIMAKFCRNSIPVFRKLNNGFVCTDNKLFIGQLLCTAIPG